MRFLPMIFWMERKESHNFLENPHSHQLWSWSSQKKEKLPYPICSVVASGIGDIFFFLTVQIYSWEPSSSMKLSSGDFFKSSRRETWRVILVSEADIFLSESLRILAERLSQSEIGLPLRQICCHSPPERDGSLLD